MGLCPSCRKQFELHATVGLQTGLRVGDTAVCIGCASPLILEELPYEFRLMTKKEVEELDYGTRRAVRESPGKYQRRQPGSGDRK
jgi:hypothetical protein